MKNSKVLFSFACICILNSYQNKRRIKVEALRAIVKEEMAEVEMDESETEEFVLEALLQLQAAMEAEAEQARASEEDLGLSE